MVFLTPARRATVYRYEGMPKIKATRGLIKPTRISYYIQGM